MRGVVEHETTTGGSIAFIVQLARTTVARAEFVLQVGAMTRCLLKKIAIPTLRAEKGILIGIPSDTADLRMDGRGDDLHKRCGSSHRYSIYPKGTRTGPSGFTALQAVPDQHCRSRYRDQAYLIAYSIGELNASKHHHHHHHRRLGEGRK